MEEQEQRAAVASGTAASEAMGEASAQRDDGKDSMEKLAAPIEQPSDCTCIVLSKQPRLLWFSFCLLQLSLFTTAVV